MISSLKHVEEQTRNLQLTSDGSSSSEISESGSHARQHEYLATSDLKHFTPYYINVVEESHLLSNEKMLSSYEKQLLIDYQKREGLRSIDDILDADMKGCGGEKYEQSNVKHGDKVFQKFLKQISSCKDQCLRYLQGYNIESVLVGE